MNWLIPIISGWLYREDGKPNGLNYARHLIGVPIAVIMWDWHYVISYFLAGFIVYGDNSWVTKILGKKGSRLIHGLVFGLASLHPIFSIWTLAVFFILFEMADRNYIDNCASEVLRGSLGTLIFVF